MVAIEFFDTSNRGNIVDQNGRTLDVTVVAIDSASDLKFSARDNPVFVLGNPFTNQTFSISIEDQLFNFGIVPDSMKGFSYLLVVPLAICLREN